MSKDLTDLQLLHELKPVVEKNLNRHLSMRKDWNPHDYIPWSDDPRTARVDYRLAHACGRGWPPNKSGGRSQPAPATTNTRCWIGQDRQPPPGGLC
jgi:hypothetical protein